MGKKSFLITLVGGSDLVVQTKTIVAIMGGGDNVLIYRKGKEALSATNAASDFTGGAGMVVVRPVDGDEMLINYDHVDSLQDSSGSGCTVIFDAGCAFDRLDVEETKEAIMAAVESNEAGSVQVASAIVGEIKVFGAEAAVPSNWLICDGFELPKAAYPDLYSVIADAYTETPSAENFNLPDFRGRVLMGYGAGVGLTARTVGELVGEEAHALELTELPEHNHDLMVFDGNGDFAAPAGALFATSEIGVEIYKTGANTPTLKMRDGTVGSTGENTAHNNVQPSLVAVIAIYAGIEVAV